MMPLPSLAAYLINFLGNYMRRTSSTALQVVLIGVGVFLLTLAGSWAWDLHQVGLVRPDFSGVHLDDPRELSVSSLPVAGRPLPILAPGRIRPLHRAA